MSHARGLVALGEAIAVEGGTLYRAAEERAHLIHVPAALELGSRRDGDPDLSVELVRGESPLRPPAPYGVLDLRVTTPAPSAAVLEAARALDPAALVTPASFAGGYLRLRVLAGRGAVDGALVDELERPQAIASDGLGSARMIRRLTPDLAVLLREILRDGALTISAVAELRLPVLAERASVAVTFDPRALLDALAAAADERSQIGVDAIVALWAREDGVALTRSDGLTDANRSRVARILADWTVAQFAVPVAAPGRDVVATVRLQPPADIEAELTWDLSRGRTSTRIVVLALDPLAQARRLVAAGGIDRFWRETVVPALETGIVHIDVDTNLPHPIRGATTGVLLRAAANPPERVHELSEALLFEESQPRRRVVWRMSAKEPLRYERSTFALLREDGATRRVEGPVTVSEDRQMLLGVDDLPVDLVAIGAGEALLADAVVRGACVRAGEPAAASQRVTFELSAPRPQVAIAVAEGTAEQYAIELQACPHDGSACVSLGPLPARGLQLDVFSFPQFGPQVVAIDVEFDVEVPLVALDLLPERDAGDLTRATVLSFTPASRSRAWHYANPTPFRSGYRHRPHGGDDDAWSDVVPAGAALHLKASTFVASAPSSSLSPVIL